MTATAPDQKAVARKAYDEAQVAADQAWIKAIAAADRKRGKDEDAAAIAYKKATA